MIIISHRINTSDELIKTPRQFGVEVDVRSYGDLLIIQHDPYILGEPFEQWVEHYNHAFLILNTKEEGLEDRLLSIMKRHSIADFFFLDQSFPFMIKTMQAGERRSAVRVSEYESLNTALSLAGKIDWIWIDCFSKFPISDKEAGILKNAGFNLCFVSPELLGRHDHNEFMGFYTRVQSIADQYDAVCTKKPDMWLSLTHQ